jgi:hypothetical protein
LAGRASAIRAQGRASNPAENGMDRVSAKTRSLKKYEAAPLAVAHEPGDPPLAIFSPFATSIS